MNTGKAWNDFTNLLKWKTCAYREDVKPLPHDEYVLEMAYVDCLSRRFGDWEVHIFYSGNDGCWKWSAEKKEHIGRHEYPHRGYDAIGMTCMECFEECFTALTHEGIIYDERSAA